MDHVRSAAVNVLLPAGCVHDPPGREGHYPAPLSNDRRGTVEGVKAVTADDLRGHYRRLFRPNGAILTVAGNVEWGPLREQVGRLLGDWPAGGEVTFSFGPSKAGAD